MTLKHVASLISITLSKVSDIRDSVVSNKHDDVPDSINGNDEACTYYGVIKPYFMKYEAKTRAIESVSAETSLAIQRIIEDHWKVDFRTDDDAQKSAVNGIDDFLCDEVKNKFDITLNWEQIDEIIEKTMQIAKSGRHS